MRYFLLIAGILVAGLGIWAIAYGRGDPGSQAGAGAILVAGAVLFGLGAAAVDIVEAIKSNRR
jgi:hypothetical protein